MDGVEEAGWWGVPARGARHPSSTSTRKGEGGGRNRGPRVFERAWGREGGRGRAGEAGGWVGTGGVWGWTSV